MRPPICSCGYHITNNRGAISPVRPTLAARLTIAEEQRLVRDFHLRLARMLACDSDGGDDPVRSGWRYQNLRTKASDRIVDGIDDGGRRRDGAAFAETLLSEPGIRRRRL